MAATLVYLHNRVPREGAESEETDKPTSSALSVDCNKNAAVSEKSDLKEVAAEVKQVTSLSPAETEKVKSGCSDGTNNNNKTLICLPPPPPDKEEPVIEEKTSAELVCSNTTSSTQHAETPEVASSVSVCNAEADKKISNDDKSREKGSSSESGENNNNKKQSYVQIKSKRRTLLKIEKLTDTDYRTRAKMRRRALSPPSSSDEENLYIGWIAYQASLASFRRSRRTPRREVWMKAVKCIFYPVTKVCQICVKNKVGVDGKNNSVGGRDNGVCGNDNDDDI